MINQNLLLAGDDAYLIQRSLRFRSSASAYLTRTPGSTGNRKTWTWSGWIKRGKLSTDQVIFGCYTSTNTDSGWTAMLYSISTDTLTINGWSTTWRVTSSVFRDPSAWYHIVLSVDTTQATANNRIRLYINGVEQTSFSTLNNPTQNLDLAVNTTSQHGMGDIVTYSNHYYFDGYLADVNFIDGQALTPSSFGETDAQTGVWKPKKYAGTYGTNGFYLNFSDNSAATAAAIGKDSSGNGNNWTPNNISVTSGSTYDSILDVPTLTSADASNFATLNPIDKGSSLTISAGNLQYDASGFVTQFSRSTIGVTSGKWYFEVYATTIDNGNAEWGIVNQSASNTNYIGSDSNGWGFAPQTSGSSYKYSGGSATTYGSATGTGQYAVAFDADAGKVWFSDKNGTWVSSGNPASGTNESFSGLTGTLFAALGQYSGTSRTTQCQINFGQRPFAYTPPSGFKALNTFNLPTPTIGATASTQAGKNFNVVTYTGNGSTQTISGVGFQPDFVWAKQRGGVTWHNLYDVIRGTTKALATNDIGGDDTRASGLTAFSSDGFTAGSDANINGNTNTYVAWNWKANGAAVSNTAGSITSQVSANQSAGFSVVTWSGNVTSGATVGHGLGVTPKFFFMKNKSVGAATGWPTFHASMGGTLGNTYLRMDSTTNPVTDSSAWNNTPPNSSVITLGNSTFTNGSSMVAYCFAEVAGFSKISGYTGNGSTDGPFIYCGFRPKFIFIKPSSIAGESATINDGARNTYNVTDSILYPDLSNAEGVGAGAYIDFLSNGFKIRNNNPRNNASSTSYIFMAFAENPFKYSLAR